MAPLAPPSPQPAPQATIATAAAVTSATTAPTIILGKYQLGRLLGRGSFAKVYEARCVADGSVVAIKIIDKKSTIDAAMEPRIVREVAAMRRLQHHPNILKIHEVMATKSKIYLVMELASGGELFAKVLRHRRLSESAARRYFQQLTSALYFCHQNGVTHRDIKPQNMLLDQDGNLKVSDFGLSALPEQLKNGLLHTACGTPAYTAPEVVARRGYNGAKADAWSCGVILFVMLAGYLPFNDNNILAMYKKIQRRDYDFPSWISKPARSIIYKLLDPNPNTRMSIETVMKTAWFKKSLEPEGDSCSMFDSLKETKPFDEMVTAFDIISLSSGLDLSGLFETSKRREKRFTSRVSVEGVVEKVSEVGRGLGYRVEKKKGGGVVVGLGKWKVKVQVEAFQIAAETVVVEVRVVEGEVEDFEWEKMKEGLGDIVLSWHNDVVLDC